MKPITKFLCVVFIIFCLNTQSYADKGEGGQAGAFCRIGVGGRALGMGGAFSAISDDANAIYWNPAGLATQDRTQVSGLHAILSFGRSYNNVLYVQPLGQCGTMGFAWINFGVSDIDGRDLEGNPTDKFSDSENAFLLSYGKALRGKVHLGGNLKLITQKLSSKQALGFGLDMGTLARVSRHISLAVVVQDVGTSLKWNTDSDHRDKLPLVLRTGIGLRPIKGPILIAGDLEKTSDEDLRVRFGAEYILLERLGLRAGYNGEDLTMGASLYVLISGHEIRADYAYQNDILEIRSAHYVSLGVVF